jgi:hypothetical protein
VRSFLAGLAGLLETARQSRMLIAPFDPFALDDSLPILATVQRAEDDRFEPALAIETRFRPTYADGVLF